MSNLTQDNPKRHERDLTIAQDRLEGMTYRQLAARHGISPPRISQILNSEEIKDVIDTGTKELVSLVPLAVDNYKTMMGDKDHAKHYNSNQDVLKMVGIFATHTPNQMIVNVYQQHNTVSLTPEVMQVLAQVMAGQDPHIVDVVQCSDASDSKGSP